MPRLKECIAAVASHARREIGLQTFILGGRSMGGRTASMLAAEDHREHAAIGHVAAGAVRAQTNSAPPAGASAGSKIAEVSSAPTLTRHSFQ